MTHRVALLDVNVLVALFDAEHVHHELAHDWFGGHRAHGWATCPITENGFVRVVSSTAYGLPGMRPQSALAALRRFCASGHHRFWPCDVSLCDEKVFDVAPSAGARQVTDVYLLGLAVQKRGCLATFDRSIPTKTVVGATPSSFQVIGSAD